MAHLVLARKYRPKNFDQVIGQASVVETLKAAIKSERFAHAYLFTGSRGVGKTTIARIVAKAMVCTNRNDANPCSICAQCKAIDDFSSLDVLEIDGASHTGVDDIRELRESARYEPASAKYKIFIIDEVHMLSINAFNALLKILEEPPPHVVFMFATTESHKLPKTILSRCQRYDFRRVELKEIVKTLQTIAKREERLIDDEGLRLLAEAADGGMRDALSMMEQVFSANLTQYSAQEVAAILGMVSHQAINEMVQAIVHQDVSIALKILKDVYVSGLDVCELLDGVVERIRVLSLCAHLDNIKEAEELSLSISDQDFQSIKQKDKEDLRRLFAMALDGLQDVFSSRKPLLHAELFILRLGLRPALKDAVQIGFHLNRLEAMLRGKPLPVAEAPTASKMSSPPVEKKNSLADPPKPKAPLNLKDPVEVLTKIIDLLLTGTDSWGSHLRHARPKIDEKTKVLHLDFEQSLHFERITEQYLGPLRKAVKEVLGPDFAVKTELIRHQEAPVKSNLTVAELERKKADDAEKALYEEAKNHPLVQKVMQMFDGEITKVARLELPKD